MANRNRSRSRPATDEETRTSPAEEAYGVGETTLNLDDVSEEELRELYFEDDEADQSLFNLPTVSGFALIAAGIVYLLSSLNVWSGAPMLDGIIQMLPIVGGIVVILVGFGLISHRRSKSKKDTNSSSTKAKTETKETVKETVEVRKRDKSKKRLERSRSEKKLAGVCGGIAEYFSLDPTLIRIGFVIGVVASGGPFVLAYLGLWYLMPKEKKASSSEQIRIIREG